MPSSSSSHQTPRRPQPARAAAASHSPAPVESASPAVQPVVVGPALPGGATSAEVETEIPANDLCIVRPGDSAQSSGPDDDEGTSQILADQQQAGSQPADNVDLLSDEQLCQTAEQPWRPTSSADRPYAAQPASGGSPLPTGDATAGEPQERVTVGGSTAIYDRMLSLFEPPTEAGTFERCGSLADVRQGAADPRAVLAKLREEFGDEDLRQAGVIDLDDQVGARLHADLIEPATHWLALRDGSGTVYEIVGRSGCLRLKIPVLAAVVYDNVFRAAVVATGRVLVVGELEEMLVLQSHGVPAVTAAGLVEHSDQVFNGIETMLGGQLPESKHDSPGLDLSISAICLVGWSIIRGDPTEPPEFAGGVATFRKWQVLCGFDAEYVCLWRPTPEELIGAKRAMWRGNQNEILQLMTRGVDAAENLVQVPATPPPPKATLAELMEQQIEAGAEWQSLSSSERKLRKKLFQTSAKPLIEQAEACADDDRIAAGLLIEQALRGYALHLGTMQRIVKPDADSADKSQLAENRQQLQDFLALAKALRPPENTPRRSTTRVVTIDAPASYVRLAPK